MRRTLTAEQQAKRDERRGKFKQLWKSVAAMPELERIHLSAKYGFRKLDGGEFSPCNSMLIAMQLPAASVLGGFRSWLRQGRAVRKGEHGAMVWVPIGKKTETETGTETDTGGERPGFIIGTIFDIGQTQEVETGDTGQDRQNYTDTQDRESYAPSVVTQLPEMAVA
jgi:hypothetical protein